MNIRIYETGDLDLETIGDMLWQADRQANFHPDSRWILKASAIDEQKIYDSGSNLHGRLYKDFYVKWIGREAVIMWLCSNQILFEVTSFDLLKEEQEALEDNIISGEQETFNRIN